MMRWQLWLSCALPSLSLLTLVGCDKPGKYEPGYEPGSAAECARLRAALFDDSAVIIASQPPSTVEDPRLRLEAGLTERVHTFVEKQCYRQPGWAGEDGVHLSGTETQGDTHGWVRVWYSPEVVAWLARGRPEGEVPDEALIIKERYKPLGEAKEDGGVFKFVAWQPMVRRPRDVRDGWFWAEISQEEGRHGEAHCHRPPLSWESPDTLRLDDCRPPSSFGQPCLRCHASQRDLTFSQTSHLPENTGGVHEAKQTIYNFRRVWRKEDAHNPDYDYEAYKNTPASTFVADHPDRPKVTHALGSADTDFVELYGIPPSEQAPHEDVPRAFDHVIPKTTEGKQDTFLTSDQCWGCHSGVGHIAQKLDSPGSMVSPDGMFSKDTKAFADVSPFGEWSVSMMGLAGRDPVFRAQREWEADHRSACGDKITDLCYNCHGAAGQHQLHMDQPKRAFEHAMVYALPDSPDGKYGSLARDGVTCTVCHQISGEGLGTPASYTGNWKPTAPGDLQGPFAADVRVDPMVRALGKTPSGEGGRDRVMQSSALCGSCHAVKLPVRKVGSCTDEHHGYEQATFLEWRDSNYRKNDDFVKDEGHDGSTPQRCQDCHMPRNFDKDELQKKMASVEDTDFPTANLPGVPDLHVGVNIVERRPFSRHQLNGINLFALSMFAQAPRVLGLTDYDYMSNQYGEPVRLQMATALRSGRSLADTAAMVDIGTPSIKDGALEFAVTVTNKAGHKLPSGVAFRRAFLEVAVEDASGGVLWASGRTNGAGAIVGHDGNVLASEFDATVHEPHHEIITAENQVQIYEERTLDSNHQLTTSFLGIYESIKDNRLLPAGWKSHFAPTMEDGAVPDGLEPHGVDGDADYPKDGSPACGCDVVIYRIPLEAVTGHANVRARLHYQAIPPYFLRDRFAVGLPDAQRLYQLASHLDTKATTTAIPGWKLPLTESVRASH